MTCETGTTWPTSPSHESPAPRCFLTKSGSITVTSLAKVKAKKVSLGIALAKLSSLSSAAEWGHTWQLRAGRGTLSFPEPRDRSSESHAPAGRNRHGNFGCDECVQGTGGCQQQTNHVPQRRQRLSAKLQTLNFTSLPVRLRHRRDQPPRRGNLRSCDDPYVCLIGLSQTPGRIFDLAAAEKRSKETETWLPSSEPQATPPNPWGNRTGDGISPSPGTG